MAGAAAASVRFCRRPGQCPSATAPEWPPRLQAAFLDPIEAFGIAGLLASVGHLDASSAKAGSVNAQAGEGLAMPDEESRSRRQQVAEADIEGFKDQLGPFVVAAETTRMPMVFTDAQAPGSPVIFVNESFLTLLRYSHIS